MCRGFYLRTWIEALNVVREDQSSELRDPEKVFYPPAIRVTAAAPIESSAAALAQSTHVEAFDLVLGDKALASPLTSIEKEVPALDRAPSSVL